MSAKASSCSNSRFSVMGSAIWPRSINRVQASKMRPCGARAKCSGRRNSEIRSKARLLTNMAPSSAFSASMLCGTVRKALLLLVFVRSASARSLLAVRSMTGGSVIRTAMGAEHSKAPSPAHRQCRATLKTTGISIAYSGLPVDMGITCGQPHRYRPDSPAFRPPVGCPAGARRGRDADAPASSRRQNLGSAATLSAPWRFESGRQPCGGGGRRPR